MTISVWKRAGISTLKFNLGKIWGRMINVTAQLARLVAAVKTGQLFEIKSCDILQPGPAALTDGVAQLHRIFMDWNRVYG